MIHTQRQEQELSMLRSEIEMLMSERQSLLRTVGAAAVFIANLDDKILLGDICKSARVLSASLNDLPEETLSDALEKVNSKFIICE
ncbi:MAG: hypothetical protein E6Q61_06750 [Nitrosomonas sp.]|nr:MAG: hypothetical protein E6Q61_06750 [Nitrosomonas sp.]